MACCDAGAVVEVEDADGLGERGVRDVFVHGGYESRVLVFWSLALRWI